MAVLTNETSFQYCVEASEGTLGGDENWYLIEPNDITTFGPSISTVQRNPISQDRMDRKGTISDLDSSVEFTEDFTISSFKNFIDGFLFSTWKSQASAEYNSTTTSAFEHDAFSSAVPEGHLIYARNSAYSANNGLFVVDTGSTTTSTPVTSTLTADASPANGARFDVVGVQGGTGDIAMDADGNLTSTILDFTTLNLQLGQSVYVGGTATDTSFSTAGKGFGRITKIEANQLSLDKVPTSFGTDDGSGKDIQIFFGSFIRNVSTNDSDYQDKTYQFEMTYKDLYSGPADGYHYAKGNRPNTLTFNIPLSDKATVDWAFVGLDTEDITDTRKSTTGSFDNATYDTTALNTTSDFARLTLLDSNKADMSTYFKSLTLTINNNVSPEKVIGTLGAAVMNIGDFNVSGSTEVLFSDPSVINAVRNNETVSMDFAVNNSDGCIHVDIPSMTLGNSSVNLPRNETVKIGIDSMAFKDDTFGHVIGFTHYPYIPGL